MPAKIRVDRLLVERGLCSSRTRAQALIMAGEVLVEDRPVEKPGTSVPADAPVRLRGTDHGYVSRGGLKLAGALSRLGASVRGHVVLDIGASTGGFTDCALQHGAVKVFAVDVGYGQLAWKLSSDPRVVVLDRQNIRTLSPTQLGEPIDTAVVDCSFISLAKVLPHVPALLKTDGQVIALVKPQFEVGREHIGKGGIVRDEGQRERAVLFVSQTAKNLGFDRLGRCESPIQGREGNIEFFVWLQLGSTHTA
ncbi:MAG: TlyA family RNA methyltransferase [Myxococcales bacterium FL481]|nr:MAG: TlyA family RNA methyltransferase [Myxococcales bacterium FL481]